MMAPKMFVYLIITIIPITISGGVRAQCCGTSSVLLICSNRELTEVPTCPEHSHITALVMDNNQIKKLTDQSFDSFPTLEILQIRNNMIWDISEKTFSNVKSLQNVDLYSNRVGDLQSLVLPSSTTILDVGRNILNLREGSNGPHAPNLETFLLQECHLESFPADTLRETPKVKTLSLKGNHLKVLSTTWFLYAEELENLDVSRNEISSLVFYGRQLNSLRTLDLSFNDISSLTPNMFGFVPELEILSLNGNRIRRLSEGPILVHGNIKDLSLAQIGLSGLPKDTFEQLPNLKSIDLSSNVLRDVEDVFSQNMPTLRILILSDNFITSITEQTFSGLSQLQELYLNDNDEVQPFNASVVEPLKSITLLDVSNTPIVCECLFDYWSIATWAEEANVELIDACENQNPCAEKPYPTTTIDPNATCIRFPEICTGGESCCLSGKCTVNFKCRGAAISVIHWLTLVIIVSGVTYL